MNGQRAETAPRPQSRNVEIVIGFQPMIAALPQLGREVVGTIASAGATKSTIAPPSPLPRYWLAFRLPPHKP
jgi:hypothetical protein